MYVFIYIIYIYKWITSYVYILYVHRNPSPRVGAVYILVGATVATYTVIFAKEQILRSLGYECNEYHLVTLLRHWLVRMGFKAFSGLLMFLLVIFVVIFFSCGQYTRALTCENGLQGVLGAPAFLVRPQGRQYGCQGPYGSSRYHGITVVHKFSSAQNK
jgi:hypothetical protein